MKDLEKKIENASAHFANNNWNSEDDSYPNCETSFERGALSPEAKAYWQQEAIEIIETLMSYGRIRTVKGVNYPAGTHEEMLDRADKWLFDNRPQNKKK